MKGYEVGLILFLTRNTWKYKKQVSKYQKVNINFLIEILKMVDLPIRRNNNQTFNGPILGPIIVLFSKSIAIKDALILI